MKSDHRGLAVLGLVLTVSGGLILMSHWALPWLSSSIAGIGAFPLVIGLLLLGVAEEQWRTVKRTGAEKPEATATASQRLSPSGDEPEA